jgi:hypothetical protein
MREISVRGVGEEADDLRSRVAHCCDHADDEPDPTHHEHARL